MPDANPRGYQYGVRSMYGELVLACFVVFVLPAKSLPDAKCLM